MTWVDPALAAATFVISFLLTPWVKQIATSRRILDIPGARSSHSRPIPRLGGVSIVVTFNLALLALLLMHAIDTSLALALLGGGMLVATVGTLDDRSPLPVYVRIITHFAAAGWAVYVLGGAAAIRVGGLIVNEGTVGKVLNVVSIVWALNLFNFMDGIDGLAASEGTFITLGGGIIAITGGASPTVAPAIFALSGATLGFLRWNWQPARIFMGDVGSGYLGYCIAVLTLSMARQHGEVVLAWLILGGVFFVDATVTLLRRLARGDNIHEAHRTHAYQWLARNWRGHQRVTLVVLGINIAWLFPCALLAARYPDRALALTACALTPLVLAACAAGAGRPERALHGPTALERDLSADV